MISGFETGLCNGGQLRDTAEDYIRRKTSTNPTKKLPS